MMIAERIKELTSQLPDGVRLVAVSKFHSPEHIMQAYDAGQRIFGESRVQEMVAKVPQLPSDIEWHFIGHLQKNKVRQLIPHVTMIHSVDTVELLRLIDKEAARIDRQVEVLLEIHVAQEQAKSGFLPEEVLRLAREGAFAGLTNVTVRGLMTMATFTDDMAQVDREFALAHDTFVAMREALGAERFDQLSMGMSDDWPVALKHGTTMVRIGTTIFGPREY